EDPRIRVAAERDRCRLLLAVAEGIVRVHEHGRDAVLEVALQAGVEREVHPPELLDRRLERRELPLPLLLALVGGEVQPVVQRIELRAAWLLVLDREADEVVRRRAALPV